MRNTIAIVATIYMGFGLGLGAGCGNGEDEGKAAAAAQAAADQKNNPPPAQAQSSPQQRLPVPMDVQIPCAQLIDPAAFTSGLGEKDPMTVTDQSATNKDSTSTCSLVRGGKRPSTAEMNSALKKDRRLGTLPGDVVCRISTFCSLLENEKHFEEHCKEIKDSDNQDMGSYACVHVVGQGADDVNTYRFLDPDTRCVIEVRGGPSMVDNDVIAKCAKAARDSIGPDQIKPPAK